MRTLSVAVAVAATVAAALLSACGGGGGGGGSFVEPPRPAAIASAVAQFQALPGLDVAIVSIAGGTGPSGHAMPGDVLTMTYTVRTHAGDPVDVATLTSGATYVSGPSSNYQRVIAPQSDVRAASVYLGDATWRYIFPPLPATSLPPFNDTPSFGPEDGERTGLPLLDGTYTVGLELLADYTFGSQTFHDPGASTIDFLLGGSPVAIAHREVVANPNCNVCHSDLRAHEGTRKDVRTCVLCHTSGAEDSNDPSIAGGTPGRSIDFRVMIHKLHNGEHLPSVVGVATLSNGARDYTAPPEPYVLSDGDDAHDFSDVAFPVWPSLNVGMPRDFGYSALPSTWQAKQDQVLLGVVACAKCHGDPDGAGPLAAPAQGEVHETEPSKRACSSCHDDVRFDYPYSSNGQTMPPQATDTACATCHVVSGTSIAIRDAHLHPLRDPALAPGLRIDVLSVTEAGAHNGNGRLDPGEKIAVTFDLHDGFGTPVPPSALGALDAAFSGPTSNSNHLLDTSVPLAIVTGSPPYTVNLPQQVVLERVGVATAGPDVFTTSRTPHLDVTGAPTTVFERTATSGGSSTATSATALYQNFVDVASVASFARDDFVVLADGTASEEYAQILLVDGLRLWLNVPLRQQHAAATTVKEVTLTSRAAGTDYTLVAATGSIVEGPTPFGTGDAIVVTYWSDYVVPARYAPPLNDSPDLGETWGEWTGKSLVAGTYTVGLWGSVDRFVNYDRTSLASTAGFPDATTYRDAAPPATRDVLVGAATTIEPYAVIDPTNTCYACHDDVYFHGGQRRGFGTCILCHGTMGSEDRARYTAANAPATTGVAITFREMLHKIHRGKDLPDAATYAVVGFGAAAYPNNFTANSYADVELPAMPGGTKECAKCHGTATSWTNPPPRNHPTEQVQNVRVWGFTCGSCHSSIAAHAHIDSNTTPTAEACPICHGPGGPEEVAKVHVLR